jgi:hypothetical protein
VVVKTAGDPFGFETVAGIEALVELMDQVYAVTFDPKAIPVNVAGAHVSVIVKDGIMLVPGKIKTLRVMVDIPQVGACPWLTVNVTV